VLLNANFALSEPCLDALAVLISAFTKFDEYFICIAIITMEYESVKLYFNLAYSLYAMRSVMAH